MSARSVNDALKDPFEIPASSEQEIPARLQLKDRVLVAKPHAFLVRIVEREAETTVNPTLADLRQAPYSVLVTQGICDSAQIYGVGDVGKAIVLLDEVKTLTAGSSSDVLVAIEHDHGSEGWMRTEPDRQVAPLRIQNMKRVVVDIGPGLLLLDM